MSAASARQALQSASALDTAYIFKQQADRFEEELPGTPAVPDEYLSVFVDVISDPAYASQPGAWNFIARMYTDREKLDGRQLHRILNAYVAGYAHYRDERMRLLACDFIARAFEPSIAVQAFEEMAEAAPDKKASGPLRVGLDLLENRTLADSPVRSRARALLAVLVWRC
jgi:hypothetical protein